MRNVSISIPIFLLLCSCSLHSKEKNKISIGLFYSKNIYASKYDYSEERFKWGLFNYDKKDVPGSPPGLREFNNFSLGASIEIHFSSNNTLFIKTHYSREDIYVAEDAFRYNIAWYYTDVMEVPIMYKINIKPDRRIYAHFQFGLNTSFIINENAIAFIHSLSKRDYIESNRFRYYRSNFCLGFGFNIKLTENISISTFTDYRLPQIYQTFSTIDRIRTSKICFGMGINYLFGKRSETTEH